MLCYNAVIADARMPSATDLQAGCSILSPELALPAGSHATTTRSHGALHILGNPPPLAIHWIAILAGWIFAECLEIMSSESANNSSYWCHTFFFHAVMPVDASAYNPYNIILKLQFKPSKNFNFKSLNHSFMIVNAIVNVFSLHPQEIRFIRISGSALFLGIKHTVIWIKNSRMMFPWLSRIGCLDTLAVMQELKMGVTSAEEETQAVMKVYSKEDYSVVNRFESKWALSSGHIWSDTQGFKGRFL